MAAVAGVEVVGQEDPRRAEIPFSVRASVGGLRTPTIGRVPIERMDHVGIVVTDLRAATEFFRALGLELIGEASLEGGIADRVTGLNGVRSKIAMLQTPDGHGRIELSRFHAPADGGDAGRPRADTPGLRHVTLAVRDIEAVLAAAQACGGELVGELARYEDSFRLCYVRGPDGVIVELAERLD
jgi:catechol 2,3-dioxygenase-like lactoylglutathione lyase family enzyme